MNSITISKSAQLHSTDATYVFRVNATIITSGRDMGSPARNIDYANAISYANYLTGTGRYRNIRIDLDTF